MLQLLALQEHRLPGERAFGRRRRGKRAERGPQMLLVGGIDRDAFTAKDGSEPFRSPGTLTRIVDPRERLQGQALPTFLVLQRAAEILPVAATGNRCRPNPAPNVEIGRATVCNHVPKA